MHGRGNGVVKIADFGLATTMKASAQEHQRCGSPGYLAPEVLNDQGYDTKADIFSAGVVLYMLYPPWSNASMGRLSGTPPFGSSSPMEVLYRNQNCDVKYEDERWNRVSVDGRDLVRRLLRKDPDTRPTAQNALLHPWLRAEDPIPLNSPAANMARHEGRLSGLRSKADYLRVDYCQELNEHPDNKSSIEDTSYLHIPITLATRRRHNSSKV